MEKFKEKILSFRLFILRKKIASIHTGLSRICCRIKKDKWDLANRMQIRTGYYCKSLEFLSGEINQILKDELK